MKNDKGNLLVVDDEANILSALKRIFVAEQFHVETAQSGIDALKILKNKKSKIDIIISDMRMPIMDGAEFLKNATELCSEAKRILLTGYADINSAISAINQGKIDYYISKPWKNEDLIHIVTNLLENKRLKENNNKLQKLLTKQNKELKLLNAHLEDKVIERTLEVRQSYQELQETHDAAIQVMLSIQELNEGEYKGYCRGVATQAKLLAQKLKLGQKEVEAVYLAAMLHNLGKHALPNAIMFKSFTQLKIKEHAEFIQYPILGATALAAFPALKAASQIILNHRECYDGSGYPNSLKSKKIPLGARILGVVVDYNELQRGLFDGHHYHAKLALKYLSDHQNRYDPKILSTFIALLGSLPESDSGLDEDALTADELQAGMVLSRSLISNNGFVFLIKGYKLTNEIIEHLKRLENAIVYVEKATAGFASNLT
jgi:response regulator RpfG family c-di-GMP phosphodiesterase